MSICLKYLRTGGLPLSKIYLGLFVCRARNEGTHLFDETLDLHGAPADIERGLEQLFHLFKREPEPFLGGEAGKQIAALALLHAGRSLHGAAPYDLVELLTVAAPPSSDFRWR